MSSQQKSQLPSISTRVIIMLGLLSALSAASIDIYLPALNAIALGLDATNAQAQMTIAIFFFGFGFGQLFFGPLSDSIGRRPVILTGLYLYVFASLACSFSNSIELLTFNRLLQAFGGCASAVTARAIIRDRTEGPYTAKALSSIVATVQVAPLIAPPVGGLILLFAPWPVIFHTLSIYGVACIFAAHLWVKESHPKENRQPLKLKNVALGYIETLRNPNIVLLLLAEISASFSLLTFIAGSALLFGKYYDVSAQSFSLLFVLVASGLIFGSYLSSRFVTSFGISKIINFCLVIGFFACIALLIISCYQPDNLYFIIASLWICLIPCATVRANYIAFGMQYMPTRSGTVSALFGAFGLSMGGIASIIIGKFTTFTPLHMAIMISFGFLSSTTFYLFWRFYSHSQRRQTNCLS